MKEMETGISPLLITLVPAPGFNKLQHLEALEMVSWRQERFLNSIKRQAPWGLGKPRDFKAAAGGARGTEQFSANPGRQSPGQPNHLHRRCWRLTQLRAWAPRLLSQV